MKSKYLKIIYLIFTLLLFVSSTWADLIAITASESELPYSLSHSNYSNSPSKYSNSPSKFSNSNYKNSPSNFKNGEINSQRLLREENGSYFYIGYYVRNDEGLINFFSPNGDRLFYSPPETEAIFHGQKGEFCGTLASLNDQLVLVVTEKGQMAFPGKGISIFSKPNNNMGTATGSYPGVGSGHLIQENVDSGSIIILEDGPIWKIDPIDKVNSMLWLPVSSVTVVESNDGTNGFDYLLINTDYSEKAHAKYIGIK